MKKLLFLCLLMSIYGQAQAYIIYEPSTLPVAPVAPQAPVLVAPLPPITPAPHPAPTGPAMKAQNPQSPSQTSSASIVIPAPPTSDTLASPTAVPPVAPGPGTTNPPVLPIHTPATPDTPLFGTPITPTTPTAFPTAFIPVEKQPGTALPVLPTLPVQAEPLFTLTKGSLFGQLQAWAKQEGYALVWNAPRDYQLEVPASFQGSFLTALQELFKGLNTGGAMLRVTVHQGNHVVEVIGD